MQIAARQRRSSEEVLQRVRDVTADVQARVENPSYGNRPCTTGVPARADFLKANCEAVKVIFL